MQAISILGHGPFVYLGKHKQACYYLLGLWSILGSLLELNISGGWMLFQLFLQILDLRHKILLKEIKHVGIRYYDKTYGPEWAKLWTCKHSPGSKI
jgi:hypothetical protein